MTPPAEQPDEKKDVIIQHTDTLDPSTNTQQHQWNVFIGPELLDAFGDRNAAVTEALKLAWANGCRAWLREGGSTQPVTNDDRAVDFTSTCPSGHAAPQRAVVGSLRRALDDGAPSLRCGTCHTSWTPDRAEADTLRKLIAPFEPKSD